MLGRAVDGQLDTSTDRIAIRRSIDQAHAEPMVASRLIVAQYPRWLVESAQDEVEIAVEVEVGIGQATTHERLGEIADRRGRFEAALSTEEELPRLPVDGGRRRGGDLRLDVAVGLD